MKNKLFICFIPVSTVCYSCQKELTYSCMPEVNEIVKENLSEIRTMTRAQWLKSVMWILKIVVGFGGLIVMVIADIYGLTNRIDNEKYSYYFERFSVK